VTDDRAPDAAAPPGQEGIHRRLALGWAGKMLALAIAVAEQILLVPVFLFFWGPAIYGDWLVMLSTAGLLVLLDAGLQTYYANAFHLALSRGEADRFRRLLHQAAAAYTAIVAVALPAALLAGALVRWPAALNLGSTGAGSASFVLALLAAFFLTRLPFGAANAVYRAHGDYVVGVMVANAVQLGLIGTIALTLWAGGGMVALALAYLAVVAASWGLLVSHQRRRYPQLRFGIARPDGAALRALGSVAPFYALAPAATMVTTQGTVILIAALAAGGRTVVAYATLRTLTGIARIVTDQVTQVTGVEIARQFAQRDRRALTALYDFTCRLAGGLCGALSGAVAFFGPPFLAVWTLDKVPFEPAIFWPLLAAAALAGPSIAGASVLTVINRPRGIAGAAAAAAAVVLVLCLVLIPRLGGAGAAWAVLAAEACVLSVVLPVQTAKAIGGSAVARIAITQLHAGAAFSIGAGGAWLSLWYAGDETLAGLVLAGLLWCCLALPPLFLLLFNRARRQWIMDRLRERSAA
jgi:O-antigen/teichoic acid export membrane protein